MEYTIDKKFRKRVNDYNQDIKNLSPLYLITKEGICYIINSNTMELNPYNAIGGKAFIITEGFKLLDEINENIILDSTAIYTTLNTAKGLGDTLLVEGNKIGIMKNDIFSPLGIIVPDEAIKFEDSECRENIKKKIDSLSDKFYWLTDSEMNEILTTKKYKAIHMDDMVFRIFKGNLSHLRKTDKVAIYMEKLPKSKYGQMIEVILLCQRDSFLSAHVYTAVHF